MLLEFIKEQGFLALRNLGVSVKRYGRYWNLSYSQIDSPKFHPVVDQCRGSIFDEIEGTFACRPFDRFYNFLEDPHSESFPILNAEVTEKIDGSLIKFWYNKELEQWCAGTRKMAFAEGKTPGGTVFADLIVEALGGMSVDEFMCACKHYTPLELQKRTYLFELVSPESRVVKPYGETKLYYLATRNNETGLYTNPLLIKDNGKSGPLRLPATYTFDSWENILEAAKALPATDEGYVTKYGSWRIKLKNPAYVALAHMHNNGAVSPRRIVALVLRNEYPEYLSYFPEDAEMFNVWVDRINYYKRAILLAWDNFCGIKDQKEFALAIKDSGCTSVLFRLRKGESLEEIFESYVNRNKVSSRLVQTLEEL